ncbi:hypothetical protein KL86CLO1_11160 [uncultured Eubacteriales bacterium]|uniref:Uncharacterized protein n=1 Tax=uncultured Eubacteriales bacterium TaxID=172733 RepID=A0A212JII9_9FIRM|nr:hypothetical protein KL86CLO1_11160 [uncultured Eubacteriales bacterium]
MKNYLWLTLKTFVVFILVHHVNQSPPNNHLTLYLSYTIR